MRAISFSLLNNCNTGKEMGEGGGKEEKWWLPMCHHFDAVASLARRYQWRLQTLPLSQVWDIAARDLQTEIRAYFSPSLSYTRIYWLLTPAPHPSSFSARYTRPQFIPARRSSSRFIVDCIGVNLSPRSPTRAVLENKKLLDPQSYKSCREQCTSSSSSSSSP